MEKTKKALFVFTIAIISLFIIIGRYFHLMVLTPRDEVSSQKKYRVERGPILDRNGVVIYNETRSVTSEMLQELYKKAGARS